MAQRIQHREGNIRRGPVLMHPRGTKASVGQVVTRNGLRLCTCHRDSPSLGGKEGSHQQMDGKPGTGDRRRSERVSRRPPAMNHAVVGSDHPTPTCLSSFHVNIPHRDLDRTIERGGTGEIAGKNQHTESCHPGYHPPARSLEGPQTSTTSSARQGVKDSCASSASFS